MSEGAFHPASTSAAIETTTADDGQWFAQKPHGNDSVLPAAASEAASLSVPASPKSSPRISPPTAEYLSLMNRARTNQLFELRVIEHQRLVSEDKDNKKSYLEASIRSKRRRHDSCDANSSAAAAETDTATSMEGLEGSGVQSGMHPCSGEQEGDCAEGLSVAETQEMLEMAQQLDEDVVTVVTISTPIRTPARSPATVPASSSTTTTTTTTTTTVVTNVHDEVTPRDEADLQQLRSQGLVKAALRERHDVGGPASERRRTDDEFLQSLRQTGRVAGLLSQPAFVRTLENTLRSSPLANTSRNTPLRRRSTAQSDSLPRGVSHEHQQHPSSVQATVDESAVLPGTVQSDIVFLSRSAPVTRVLQGEQRQVLEIHIRHRIEAGGRPPVRSNPTGVLLRQAHQLRQTTTTTTHTGSGHDNHDTAAPAASVSVLQAQIRIMTEQMAELARMVTASYQLQLDMQRSMNQQVAAVFNTFQTQARASSSTHEGIHSAAFTAPAASAVPVLPTAPHPPAAFTAPIFMPSHQHQHQQQQQPHQQQRSAVSSATGGSASGPHTISSCVICEQQVDSVLYRCGHMCVCGLCARQLKAQDQWCPMCRAPIEDIVRVYFN